MRIRKLVNIPSIIWNSFCPPGQINIFETHPSVATGSIFRFPTANVSNVLTDVVPTAMIRPVHELIASIVSCGIAMIVKDSY